MDWQREVIIPRVTVERVNEQVQAQEARLRAVEVALGLREPDEDTDNG